MRISTFQIYQQSVNSMLTQQADLAKTQQQLSVGKSILTPADNPAAAARVLELGQLIETNSQLQRNADSAETRLRLEEDVLTQTGDLLQVVRGLAVQGNNATYNAVDRQAIAFEVRARLDELMQIANSKEANGEYLFSGYKTSTTPFTDDGLGNFTYNGDQGQRELQIGPTRKIAASDDGNSMFMQIDDGAGGLSDMFSVLYDFSVEMDANTPNGNSIARIDSAIDLVSTKRASIGARLNSIDGQRETNTSFEIELQRNRSSLEDLDYAEAVSRFQRQNIALQASQQTFAKIEQLSLFNYL